MTEENFFFKLSAFQQPLLDLIESGKLSITPESRKNEVLSFVRGGLKDLSISRSSFTWGIPVPEPAANLAAQKHVIYVWLDALANYMTALGYGSDDETLYKKFWPANLHLVGKEIIRFHCVYWPAFLLAADLPLPKAVTAHGWLLFEDSKMSKSKGNIVRTETILDAFGSLCPPSFTGISSGLQPTESDPNEKGALAPGLSAPTHHDRDLFASDVLRYFLLREIPFGQDGSFSFDALITRYNADLANGYGNLVSRTLKMIDVRLSGFIPKPLPDARQERIIQSGAPLDLDGQYDDQDYIVRNLALFLSQQFSWIPEDVEFAAQLYQVDKLIAITDEYLTRKAPWKLGENEIDNVERTRILYTAAESIRIITALLYPILPYATAKVWATTRPRRHRNCRTQWRT